MGRKKDKAGKADKPAGKSGRIRIPKQIGSMKIPKDVRKSGEALIEAARDAVVREMAVAGVAAMVANAAKARTPAPEKRPAPRSQTGPVEAVIVDDHAASAANPDQLLGAIGLAAAQALRQLIDRSRT